ncbi:hypothetical protein [Phocaeicola sp.]|uniref:hypothetical protein n=1 Tax=Phocaeicola sp. TaxID=2773926 RepID=UPI003AB41F5F
MNKCKYVRLSARVTLADYKRLEEIRRKYGFKSIYQILNYLTYSFLRVADREHDTIAEPVPEEIERMFEDLGTPALPVRYRRARPVRRSADL